MVKFVRMSSNDEDMVTFFQTFSAADLHWQDLHRILPSSDAYLDKRVVKNLEDVPAEEQENCITETDDYLLRSKSLKENADLVDWYFYHRLDALKELVLPV